MTLKNILKRILPGGLFRRAIRFYESIPIRSIRAALREQGLSPIYDQLVNIVPDITHQYSSFDIDTEYLRTTVRAQHAFQISLVNEALSLPEFAPEEPLTIADIGDSAGTHIQYIKGLFQDRDIRSLSINVDGEAVKRIQEKGLEAVRARAEDLPSHSIKADIFLSFEMLEHLMNPFEFLKKIANTPCKLLILTVPYLASSRVGLHHIRHNQKNKMTPETTHIFELSPDDWRLIFKHSGWGIIKEKIYYRYPKNPLFKFWLKDYWRKHDFEGFYGVILKQDKTWSELYNGW
jgi:hypothetical protein